MSANERTAAILAVVASIPRGRVATYGQIALLAGYPGRARLVGTILRDLPEDSAQVSKKTPLIPWFRVLGASGTVSERGDPIHEGFQRHLLEEEGVEFSPSGRVDFRRFGWDPLARPKRQSTKVAETAPPPARSPAKSPAKSKMRAVRKSPARSRASGQTTRT